MGCRLDCLMEFCCMAMAFMGKMHTCRIGNICEETITGWDHLST